ncbi:MAG: hypothetical protein EGQ60_09065 [Clostridiales bacterium]|nr:hypothetical protein [Clostridiales bacterium]
MTLKEQLLSELCKQNEIAQAEIKELESYISSEEFAMSTVTGGALSGTAINACKNRIQTALAEKEKINRKNAWIADMLSIYK